ncbi:TIGR03943 family putative permease subunit [Clostridium fallax]|uniref:Putative membrane protein n=1 Tax=Clostridium fallax TaxID=1533 RepID=A0A1M4XGZ1_9CLOT|nr:TIGR03943 family protein [Clostridium fallax]SHE92593.1 putative membrane protein [Clostridium fallax]SQB06405.1 membrane-spanning protein [Clostridium fallax]
MKKFNFLELLKFFILFVLTIYLYYLLSTGKITIFLHKKFIIHIKITFVVFIILTINQFTRIFSIPNRMAIRKSYFTFFLVIVLGTLASFTGLNTNISGKKALNIEDSKKNNTISKNSKVEEDNLKEDIIRFNDNNYFENLNKLGDNLDDYIGKKVIITGFVYRESNYKENQFALSRLLMTCCAADTQLVGIFCKYDNSKDLKENNWVRVTGEIESTKYKNENDKKEKVLPMIKVDSLESIEKPKNIYIYPYSLYPMNNN